MSITLLLIGAIFSASAPQPVQQPLCQDEIHAAVRFIEGKWELTNARGLKAGFSDITSDLDGCAIIESYEGPQAKNRFRLVFAYDTASRAWHGILTDNRSGAYVLKGQFTGGQLILEGDSQDADGTVIKNRSIWTPGDQNRWEQEWLLSKDGGRNWQRSFKVTYTRVRDLPGA